MSKTTSSELTPYGKGRNVQQQTPIIPPIQGASKGGFVPNADKTVLGTMNSIMSKQYKKS
jgi:hypothetical protein